MSATMTLLRLQVRLLLWPILITFAILTGSLFVAMKGGGFVGPDDVAMTARVGVLFWTFALFTSFVAWIASAWVFGAEYTEGARDYIRTRPVSERMVFWSKMSVLLPLIGCCAITAGLCTVSILTPLIVVLFLNASFSIVTMTILFRDTVRGMLFGLPAGIFIAVALAVLGRVVCGPPMIGPYNLDIVFPLLSWTLCAPASFILGAILLSPLIYLWAASWAHSFRWHSSPLPCFRSCGLLILPFAYFVFVAWSLSTDGIAVLDPPTDGPLPIAHVVVNNKMYVVSFDSSKEEYLLYVIDGNNPSSDAKVLSRFGHELFEEYGQRKPPQLALEGESELTNIDQFSLIERRPHPKVFIDDQHVVLLGSEKVSTYIYQYTPDGISDCRKIQGEFDILDVIPLRHGMLRLKGNDPTKVGYDEGNRGYAFRILDITKGEILEDHSQVPSDQSKYKIIYSGGRYYKERRSRAFNYNSPQVIVSINDVNTEGELCPNGPMIVVHTSTVDGTLIAALYMSGINNTTFETQNSREWTDTIHLCDSSDLDHLKHISLQIPFRLKEPYQYLDAVFGSIGLGWTRELLHPPTHLRCNQTLLTLGGGFLCLWACNLGRVAVWDVHNLDDIHFLGINRVPLFFPLIDQTDDQNSYLRPTTTPIVRSDGALGYVMRGYGLVWLEFPALMEEAES